MRQAKKLGLLALALGVVAGLGLLAGTSQRASAMAVAPVSAALTFNNCSPGTPIAGEMTCTANTSTTVVATGTMTKTITSPAGATIVASSAVAGCPVTAAGLGTPSIIYVCGATGTIPAGTAIQEVFATTATSVTELVVYNANGPFVGAPSTTPGTCSPASTKTDDTQFFCTNLTGSAVPAGGTLTLTITCTATPAAGTCGFDDADSPANVTTVASCSVPGAGILHSSPDPGNPVTVTYTVVCLTATPAGTAFLIDRHIHVDVGGDATSVSTTESTTSPGSTVTPTSDTWTFTAPGGGLIGGPGAIDSCTGPSGLAPAPGQTDTCSVVSASTPIPVGGSVQITVTSPTGVGAIGVTCVANAGVTASSLLGATGCTFVNSSGAVIPVGTALGTETIPIPAGTAAGTPVTETVSTCSSGVSPCIAVPGTTLAVTKPCSGPGCFVIASSSTASSLQPSAEVKACNNTAQNGALSQTIGGASQTLTTTTGTSFTLPLFGPASTCILQPERVVSGTLTSCTAVACSDGYLQVTLSTPGSGAVLSCSSGFVGTAPAGFAIATNNGGTCQPQVQGTQLNLPCGVTSGTAAAATTVSSTCQDVLFDISSTVGACVNTPTFCVNPGTIGTTGLNGLNVGSATVTVIFIATPANGGGVGGVQLGQNTFSFAGPGIGTLLVAASPQLIPSNGTSASVVSATFACTTGFVSVGGFPLSNNVGANPLTVNSAGQLVASGGCGAGLPGTFTFASPGPVLFDNGRSTESISCGPNANVNAFGNGSSFFGSIGSTFPLAFTCTGAAVLAIGAGVAGDAPINVTYTSAVGGLQAVGSTLLTVSPAGIPRISVACNPSTISAGNTGSLCTATVTDINGTPLSGITGATVTFTTSDTSDTTILPCTIGTPGAINVTTSPAVIPLVTPQTPCITPSTGIPGQVNTFINGQATALLIASSTAHPEVVTVTAALGVLIPPEFACLAAPYLPSGVGFGAVPNTPGYYSNTSGLGITGCGTATPLGTTGLATALNVAGEGLTGIVTLPNQTSASTSVTIGGPAGIQIAGATAISPLLLSRGCNNVIVTSYVGTPIANIAALVTPQNAVVSIWKFNNGTKLFNAGFFSDPNAPTDFTLTGNLSSTTPPNGLNNPFGAPNYSYAYNPGLASSAVGSVGITSTANSITESYYVCVNQTATMISG